MSSTTPLRRKNSTDPRPGSEAFPRFTMLNNRTSTMPPRRPSQAQQQHSRAPSTSEPRARPRQQHSRAPSTSAAAGHASTANTPNLNDHATKMQINQTYSIAMMASPVNPLPFFLPIPLGVAMLLTPQGSTRSAGPNGPRKAST